MSFKRKLYPDRNTVIASSSSSTEIDLRAEFDEIIYGGGGSIPHGHTLILRKMRRDADNSLVECSCRDSLTDEPDTESSCPFCLGEGYYWDENWVTGFSGYVGADGGLAGRVRGLFPGTVRVDYKTFYFRYDTDITYKDKIVEMKLDTEGEVVVPYIRESIYKPQTIVKYRSDFGRIEYIAIYCRENDAIRED